MVIHSFFQAKKGIYPFPNPEKIPGAPLDPYDDGIKFHEIVYAVESMDVKAVALPKSINQGIPVFGMISVPSHIKGVGSKT
jgi:hypothetical protein